MAPLVKILSLDGGGVRGISSLQILQELMEKIKEAQSLTEVPRPCEMFDIIGGTSTGGIIAIMLGRLQMKVDDCIKTYRRMAQKAFTPKRRLPFPAPPAGAYSATALENAIKEVIRTLCKDNHCLATQSCSHGDLLFRDETCTKTVVLATTKENINSTPTLFKTYDTATGFQDCAIWEVARATSAATTFFKSIKCGRDHIEFIDAALGYNNPCEVLIDEAKKLFPDISESQLRVISIGSGLGDAVTIRDSRTSILRALKTIATTSKKAADRLAIRYGDTNCYYRFNVDRGLEDVTLAEWKAYSKISAHTHNYLRENESYVQSCVRSLFRDDNEASRVMDHPEPDSPPRAIRGLNNKELNSTSDSMLSIQRNTACHNAEQNNTIGPMRRRRVMADISGNISSGGSKQWNSIGAPRTFA
ncbi:FabD/lysophospholipase-like protein [Hypoxylon fragiforme]|uniref:FabD/lysophospholipase-like protein n=1 Tax=Hypoxylon fragiforme TaxID=63214 RepID=UPI0020C6C018|nr:FabD/lysophospholipase-like protein [Hypoxylon fragiforme]KAI2608804.1 FabD/lysophospholipase-like protein [Hypoxylon fragiforme]